MPSVYSVDEDDKGRVRSGTLPAFVERLTNETPIDLSSMHGPIFFYPVTESNYGRERRKQDFH
jgi:hypothetical protein